METIITVWFLGTKNKANELEWAFNHISDGYDPTRIYPDSKFDSQKNWKNSKWQSKPAKLIDGKVIYDV